MTEAGAATNDAIRGRTRRRDVDAMIITALTSSSDPVMACARVQDGGRIEVAGGVGLQFAYTPSYEKENELLFARDRSDEEFGVDYSAGHVRWNEGCIIETYLDPSIHGLWGALRSESWPWATAGVRLSPRMFGEIVEGAREGEHDLTASLETSETMLTAAALLAALKDGTFGQCAYGR